jgi:predicted ATPase
LDSDPNGPPEDLPRRLSSATGLLIIDNCEHVIDAIRSSCRGFQTHCPGIRILATSQRSIGLDGEKVFRVPELNYPKVEVLTAAGETDPESVRLFFERSRAVDPGSTTSPRDRAAVYAICRQLEGLPLAIELAASRCRFLTPSRLHELLGASLELLSGESYDRDSRHQSLEATLAWSVGLLDARERATLLAASTFAGAWTVDELAALMNEMSVVEALHHVESLVDGSLVSTAMPNARHRFRLLDPVRRFSWSIVEQEGRGDELRERHLDLVIGMCAEFEMERSGPRGSEALEAMSMFDSEIVAASAWAISTGRAEAALRIAIDSWQAYFHNGRLAEGRDRIENALAMPGAPATGRLYGIALQRAGSAAWSQAEYDLAERRVLSAIEHLRSVDEHAYGVALGALGTIRCYQGRPEEAILAFRAALDMWERLGDTHALTSTLSNLAYAESEALQLDAARDHFERVFELTLREGFAAIRVVAEVNLAHTYRHLLDFDRSAKLFDVAIRNAEAQNMTMIRRTAECYRANLDVELELIDTGVGALAVGMEDFLKMGERRSVALHVEGIGLAALVSGYQEVGARLIGAAEAMLIRASAERSPAHRAAMLRVSRAAREEMGTAFELFGAEGATLAEDSVIETARRVGRVLAPISGS